MTAERSNVLAFEPLPIGWLHLPLTQERAAAIVQFEERTGIELIPHLLDALDDIVFDLGPARQPGGNPAHRAGARPAGEAERSEFVSRGPSCSEAYRLESPAPPKSTDKNCSVPTELSDDQNSFLSPESYGLHQTPPRSLPSSAARANEPPNDGSQARYVRPIASSQQPITKSSAATNTCGND
jgi:hypothetical protein